MAAKQWDDVLKRTFNAKPEDFVAWLLPGAHFLGPASLELKTLTRTITTDTLYRVMLNGQEIILHVEFERRSKKGMPYRTWEYNVLATLEHKCPVYSFVIYLSPGEKVPDPPLIWKHEARNELIHHFCYWQIKIWELPVELLRETGLVGLLPLCVLAKGGKERDAAQRVFQELKQQHEETLLSLALSFASLVFNKPDDAEWLERQIADMEDIITESLLYKRVLRKGEEKGLQQGLQQGLEKGMIEGLTMAILDTVQGRFPALLDLAQKQLMFVKDSTILRHLMTKIILAQSAEDVERYLREAVQQA